MIYLLYSETPSPIDVFIGGLLEEEPSLKRVVVDDFKNLDSVRRTILQSDSLFGEKKLLVLRDFPKAKLSFLEELLTLKGEVDLALCFVGEELSLAKLAQWVQRRGGLVKEFRSFKGRAVFKFLDALSSKNLKLAILSLRKMKEDGENLFLALSFLFTRFEKLVLAKEDATSRLWSAAASFSYQELLALQKGLLELEAKLKSEPGEAWEEVESWLALNLKSHV